MAGYKVEFSEDGKTICIIPTDFIPLEHFCALVRVMASEGYEWMLPADERCGYLFTNEKPGEKT